MIGHSERQYDLTFKVSSISLYKIFYFEDKVISKLDLEKL